MPDAKRYPLAPHGVFRTVQGEGHLLGLPMTFVRLAGCSVGCPECDTDYRVEDRLPLRDLLREVAQLTEPDGWVWVTGGEPTDHDMAPLAKGLHHLGFRTALATSGVRRVEWAAWDWLSVSPHNTVGWVLRWGNELKLVAGLNGLRLADFAAAPGFNDAAGVFSDRFACPCEGKPETVTECVAWVETHPGWRLGVQAHRLWELP